VVVNTGAGSLFNTNIDTTQNFVLAVKDAGSSMRQVMSGFGQFNRNEFRVWNLALQLKSASGYQLLVIDGIPSLNEAMSYFRKVVITRSLFQPLGQATYRNFLVTDENLQKIIDGNKVDEYMDFFRSNYIQRNQAQTPSGSSSVTPAPTQNQPVSQPATEPVQAEAEKYTGLYDENVEGPHYFVFVVPLEGIDKTAFVNGITQFNQSGYQNLQLKIEEKPLDDFRQIIAVSGLTDKQGAMQYFSQLVQNRNLYTPLGNANYRNFLISANNFDLFLKEKNIVDYMDFYKRVYLEQ
jgi:hypothetical protein